MNDLETGNIRISQLRALVAIAEFGNFSTAALELGLSQSTISHAIAALEDELGVVLLNRGRQGATLTPEGHQIIAESRQILHLVGVIQTKANMARRLQTGQVRVGGVRSVATHVLPEAIACFRASFPGLDVVVIEYDRYLEIEQALRDGRLDIGLTCLPTSAEFAVHEVFRDEFLALLPAGTLEEGMPLTWERLLACPMILNPSIAIHHTNLIREHLKQFGQTLTITYELKEDSTMLAMVLRRLGATIMPRLAAEPIPPEIQVRSLPVPLHRVIGAATLKDALLPQAAFVFLDILKTLYGDRASL